MSAALGRFGLRHDPGAVAAWLGSDEDVDRIASSIDGPVTLIAGPTGSGKSALLGRLRAHWLARGVGVVDADLIRLCPETPLAALSDTDLGLWLRTLARAGLGEARLLGRRVRELSEGERFRARLALGMLEATQSEGGVLLLDEFAGVLDRATAEGVSRALARWAGAVHARCAVRVVLASGHEDVAGFLGTRACVIRCEALRGAVVGEPPSLFGSKAGTGSRVRIERGEVWDYDALARFHYRAGRPATVAGVWRAVRTLPCGRERLAGVLVASYPTLNGRWRRGAWGKRYSGRDRGGKRRAARLLNEEVRCLSRVVVEPGSRGLGIARRLVESYLSEPLTVRTEAVTEMGGVCPFFERAGMRPHRVGRSRADERLLARLASTGLCLRDVLAGETPEGMERSLVAWANQTGAGVRRAMRGQDESERWRIAACRLASEPVAYTHGGGESDGGDGPGGEGPA
ncbi:MAG: hypothetical protein ACF8Q5_09330 [Phycisphaerales bacterium JB040]